VTVQPLAADLDPRLAAVIEIVEGTGLAAEVYDAEWRLAALTSQFRLFIGNPPIEESGLGHHAVAWRRLPQLEGVITEESGVGWMRENIPRMAGATPGGIDAIRAMLSAEHAPELDRLEPVEPEPLWSGQVTYLQPGLPPAVTRYVTTELHAGGQRLGWITLYLPAAPASLVSLITRGSQSMFERMAQLLVPARHETAILFADIQASSVLARRLSSQRWFELIREFSTAADAAVIRRLGIVGRHAGDGLTAFFLAEQTGGRGQACAAALHAAREILEWRPEGMEPGELVINAGAHWGGALYLGQVVTGGRLEVTALGDEVNECARIEQSARGGALLASKPLVERLELEDANELGLDPLRLVYRTIGELPGVTPKAVRDAGGVPVVAVPPRG